MKAFEALKSTTQSRYEIIMKEINDSIGNGLTKHRISNCDLITSEIIEKLANDGFDIDVFFKNDDVMSYIDVSWKSAKEGKIGVVTHKIIPKTKKDEEDEAFIRAVFSKPEPKRGFFGRVFPSFGLDDDCGDGDW